LLLVKLALGFVHAGPAVRHFADDGIVLSLWVLVFDFCSLALSEEVEGGGALLGHREPVLHALQLVHFALELAVADNSVARVLRVLLLDDFRLACILRRSSEHVLHQLIIRLFETRFSLPHTRFLCKRRPIQALALGGQVRLQLRHWVVKSHCAVLLLLLPPIVNLRHLFVNCSAELIIHCLRKASNLILALFLGVHHNILDTSINLRKVALWVNDGVGEVCLVILVVLVCKWGVSALFAVHL
jgi:hypothetical protein